MRKLLFAVVFLLLTGCGSRVPPVLVRDVQPLEAVTCWQEDARTVLLELPEQVQVLQEGGKWKIGELEVEQRLFLAASPEIAVKTVSGQPASHLTVLESNRGTLPRYQFTWVEDQTVCRADLLLEDVMCYGVICRRPVAAGSAYDEQIRGILASFCLDAPRQV